MTTNKILRNLVLLGGMAAQCLAAPLISNSDRIAYSSDGNFHDPDDIGAAGGTLSLLAAAGRQNQLVYFGHSDHIWNEPSAVHVKNGLTGAQRLEIAVSRCQSAYGYGNVFFSVYDEMRKPGKSLQNNAAVNALVGHINASTAQSRLWIVQAGPLEVIAEALRQANKAKFQYVTCVSHSQWNNGHGGTLHGGTTWIEYKQLLINNGGTLHCGGGAATAGSPDPQVLFPRDQNGITKNKPNAPFQGLSTEYLPDRLAPWRWMQNNSDPRISVIWECLVDLGRPGDMSDAGMIYYILNGDDATSVAKFRTFIENGFSNTGGQNAPMPGEVISLRGSNNKFVCSENGTRTMRCNRNAVGAWEKFTVVDAGGGKIALRGNNGKFVSSENGMGDMRCNRNAIGAWEKFTLQGTTVLSLKGNNNKFVSTQNGIQPMRCDRASSGQAEKFSWAIQN